MPESGRRRLMLVELMILVGIVALIVAMVVVAMATSRAKSRKSQCSSHLRQIGFELKKAQANGGRRIQVEQIRRQLTPYLEGAEGVWVCPSNEVPDSVSYGFNARVNRLHIRDSKKIVGLDYGTTVVDWTGTQTQDAWKAEIRPRHFQRVNVLFYDNHVEDLAPSGIDPEDCEHLLQYWTPTLDQRGTPEDCPPAPHDG